MNEGPMDKAALQRRLAKLESRVPVEPELVPTDDEVRALAILRHELLVPADAPITDELWLALERRLRAETPS